MANNKVNLGDIYDKGLKDMVEITLKGQKGTWTELHRSVSQMRNWMRITDAMEISDGCIVRTTIFHLDGDEILDCRENLIWIPGVRLLDDTYGNHCLA